MGLRDLFRGGASASLRKKFSDDFAGGSQSGLGTSPDGSIWKSIRGQFDINGSGSAQATDNNYPISAIDLGVKNAEVSIVGSSGGPSAALWVTDSGNWFAVGIARDAVSCNCYNYYVPYSCTGQCFAGYYNTDNCNATSGTGYCIYYSGGNCNGNITGGNCKTSSGGNCKGYSGGNCTGYNSAYCVAGSYNSKNKTYTCSAYVGGTCKGYNATSCTGYNAYTCNAWNNYVCNGSINAYVCGLWSAYYCSGYWNGSNPVYYSCPSTCYDGPYTACSTCYPQYIRVLQSVGNSISTLAQWTLSSVVNSFKVKTTDSNEIQIQAFSNSDFTSQIDGTLTYTPTGVNVDTNFGIMVSPSAYDQRYTVEDVEIKRNPS